MEIYIYQLIDPLTNEIRYVGLTRDPGERLRHHGRGQSRNAHLNYWVRKLHRQGIPHPIMEILEVSDTEGAGELEKYWIKKYLAEGKRLINKTSGGEVGFEMSEESRRKLSILAKNNPIHLRGKKIRPKKILSEKTKLKLSMALKGKPLSKENKEKHAKNALLRRGKYKHSHCKQGHEYTLDNTIMRLKPSGLEYQTCKACRKIWGLKNTARKQEIRRKLKQQSQEIKKK